jgi:hypothetical protein
MTTKSEYERGYDAGMKDGIWAGTVIGLICGALLIPVAILLFG